MVATREFKPSLRNLTEALAHDIPRSRFDIWFGRCMPVLVLGCVGWVVFTLMTTGDSRLLGGAVVGLVAGGLVCLALVWVMPRLVERTRGMRTALTRRRYRFDADALVLEIADGATVRTAYQSFRKVSMGPSHIAFYEMFPGYPTHVVTSEAFESKDQERVVRDWIATYAT
jgi:hypothetical protein